MSFEVDDLEQTWSYDDNFFDFIHIRQLIGFIDDWPKLYKQAFRVLRPGGTIEISDFMGFYCDDGTLPRDSAMLKCYLAWRTGIQKAGKKLPDEEHAAGLTEVGFENAKYEPIKIAIGAWPKDPAQKELGYYMRQHMYDGCESFALAVFTRFLNWRKEDVDLFLEGYRRDIVNKSIHSYTPLHITYATKPRHRR